MPVSQTLSTVSNMNEFSGRYEPDPQHSAEVHCANHFVTWLVTRSVRFLEVIWPNLDKQLDR